MSDTQTIARPSADPFAYAKQREEVQKEARKHNFLKVSEHQKAKTLFTITEVNEGTRTNKETGTKEPTFYVLVEYIELGAPKKGTFTFRVGLTNGNEGETDRDVALRFVKDAIKAGEKFVGYRLSGYGVGTTFIKA